MPSSSTRRSALPSSRRSVALILLVLLSSFSSRVLAAPTLQSVSLRGLQIGKATKVVFTGSDLGPNAKILLDAPIASQSAKLLAPNRLEAIITLSEKATSGVRQVRVATDKGISNALAIGVDALKQIGFAERIESLRIAMTGTLSGGQVLKTNFAGVKSQHVVVELEGQRLGAGLKPVVRLLDAKGRQLAFGAGQPMLLGDARCEATLPNSGMYQIVIHDVIYRGANPGHFRLKIGDTSYADLAFPIGVQAGKTASLNLLGNRETTLEFDARNQIASGISSSGGSPRIMVSDTTEIVETDQTGGLQTTPAAPVGVNGRLAQGQTEDRFLLPVKPGSRLRFEVFAQRIGSSLDGVLFVRGEKGNQLATNDDQNATTDPRLDYTIPAGVDKVVIALRDLQSRSGETFTYRIAVTDLARPSFLLTMDQNRINIPAGGAKTIRVDAARVAYNGPIQLTAISTGSAMPSQIKVSGNVIEAGASFALMTLSSTSDKPFAAVMQIEGAAVAVKPPVHRLATPKNTSPQGKLQPWLARTLAVGGAPADPIRTSWADGDAELTTHLGGDHELKINLQRNDGVKGDVRLKLVATQVIPKKTIKQKNKPVKIDDLERALRLETNAVVKETEKQTTVKLMIPADLPDRVWGVVVLAELLDPKTKKVTATATTTTRKLKRVLPIKLEYSGAKQVNAKAGDGGAAKLAGKIHRVAGFSKPIVVTLEGLPKGVAAPTVTLAADAVDFSLPLAFDAKTKPGLLKNIRLVGLYRPNPANKQLTVRTNAAPIDVNVVKK